MQQEVLSILGLLHDVSNNYQGASLVLNQIIDGAYGQSLEEIKPLLIGLQQTNERGMSLIQSKRTAFFELNPATEEQFDMLSFLQTTFSRFKANSAVSFLESPL